VDRATMRKRSFEERSSGWVKRSQKFPWRGQPQLSFLPCLPSPSPGISWCAHDERSVAGATSTASTRSMSPRLHHQGHHPPSTPPRTPRPETIVDMIRPVDGLDVINVSDRPSHAPRAPRSGHSKTPLTTRADLSMAYTRWLARVCERFAAIPRRHVTLTIKKHVAVMSDGHGPCSDWGIWPAAAIRGGKANVSRYVVSPVWCLSHLLGTRDFDEISGGDDHSDLHRFGGIKLGIYLGPVFDRGPAHEDARHPVFHDESARHGSWSCSRPAHQRAEIVGKRMASEGWVGHSGRRRSLCSRSPRLRPRGVRT